MAKGSMDDKFKAISRFVPLFESDPYEYPVNFYNLSNHRFNIDVQATTRCAILSIPPWIGPKIKDSENSPTLVTFYTKKDIFDTIDVNDPVDFDMHIQIAKDGVYNISPDPDDPGKTVYSIKFQETGETEFGGKAWEVHVYPCHYVNGTLKSKPALTNKRRDSSLTTGNVVYDFEKDMQLIIGIAGGVHPKMNVTIVPKGYN